MKPALPVIESHDFTPRDFIGGDAAIDFVNTVTGRDQTPRDWLDGYPRLVEWAEKAALLPETALRALTSRARRGPAAAAAALARAKSLREAAFAVLSGLAAGRAPPAAALDRVREHWIEGVRAHELRARDGRVTRALRGDATDLDLIASMVAYRLVELVLPLPAERLRICVGPNCSWLFIDRSKAGRRRWCDMTVCGNAAKSRRFYARTRTRKRGRSSSPVDGASSPQRRPVK
jgi:predicted RNA-binding Zn ribbon-like protein